jgi:uncharacterized protein YcbK (DUF882 family)
MGNRSKNFSDSEFKCKCSWRAPHLPRCEQVFVPDALIDILQDVRDHFGRPVTVHSGHRCGPYNVYVGGARFSQHVNGYASDITVEGHPPNEVQDYLLAKYPNSYGIGRYNTFTHIDVRSRKARWDNRR